MLYQLNLSMQLLVTPPKRPRSDISDTSSSVSTIVSHHSRLRLSKTPITPRSLNHAHFIHIPNPEIVARFVNYKQPTAVKTARLPSSTKYCLPT